MKHFIVISIALIGFSSQVVSANDTSLLDRIEQGISQHKVEQTQISQLASLIAREPKNYRAYIVMGSYCDYLGLPEQAMVQYALALKCGPDQPQVYLSLIKSLYTSGQRAAAENLLQQAMKRFPKNPLVLLWAGNARMKDGNYKEADSFYKAALQQANGPVLGVSTGLARVELEEKHYLSAFRLAATDLDSDKNYPPANEIAGVTLMKIGQFEMAQPYLKIAYEKMAPNYVLARNYTQSLLWSGKYDEALMPALITLATAVTNQQKEMACSVLDQLTNHLSKNAVEKTAVAINSNRLANNTASVHSQFARIALSKRLINLAVAEAYMAVTLASHSPEANYELALILETYQHDFADALKYLRRANVLAPNNYEISRHLLRVEDMVASRSGVH